MATAKTVAKTIAEIRKEALAEDAKIRREPPMPPDHELHKFLRAPGSPLCIECGLGEDNRCHGVSTPLSELQERMAKHGRG